MNRQSLGELWSGLWESVFFFVNTRACIENTRFVVLNWMRYCPSKWHEHRHFIRFSVCGFVMNGKIDDETDHHNKIVHNAWIMEAVIVFQLEKITVHRDASRYRCYDELGKRLRSLVRSASHSKSYKFVTVSENLRWASIRFQVNSNEKSA